MKTILSNIFPLTLLRAFGLQKDKGAPGESEMNDTTRRSKRPASSSPDSQNLDIYWDSNMAELLDTWGEGNVWHEIQFLMANCRGRVLDIACGTGKTIELLSSFPLLDLYGCDISDMLIEKALKRGIDKSRLKVCDMTEPNYPENYFDYAYSIGSLEHFTEEGIEKFLAECQRIVKRSSFHMIPVSRSGEDGGWTKTLQSFHNNSESWWMDRYRAGYKEVYALDSLWNDKISVGKWFICR